MQWGAITNLQIFESNVLASEIFDFLHCKSFVIFRTFVATRWQWCRYWNNNSTRDSTQEGVIPQEDIEKWDFD